MTADQLIQYLSWTLYVLLCGIATVRAVRQPRRANLDVALLFGFPALSIGMSVLVALGLLQAGPMVDAVNTTILIMLGYLLLRLVDDFAGVPGWLMRGAEIMLAGLTISAFSFPPPRSLALNLLMGFYLVALLAYATAAFMRQSFHARGVTRRRMSAVAIGALSLLLLFVLAIAALFTPRAADTWRILIDIAALASGVGFFVGFAPPRWLRRAWQEPELRAFLGRAASLPRLPDTLVLIHELERGAATSVGAPGARIGMWDAARQVLHFVRDGQSVDVQPEEDIPAAQAFRLQRPIFSPNTRYDGQTYAELGTNAYAKAALAAPITAGARRIGTLVIFAPRAPIFAEDDLALVQLLADQAAVVLESRALIDEAARVRALEEAARLKDDFLSAAAHDLKTPLTTLVARAQLLEKRAQRDPRAPADLTSIRLLVQEGQRLRYVVLELLDAARVQQGRLVGDRAPLDLAMVVDEVCARHGSERHRYIVAAHGALIGEYDRARIVQLLENMLENAAKYSPGGGTIRVNVWRENNTARLAIADSGIGIPPDDLPYIFDRFYRAGNVDDRRFAGMGLGLFICRGIVEQHGGEIWATSRPGEGSTFQIALPLVPIGAPVHA